MAATQPRSGMKVDTVQVGTVTGAFLRARIKAGGTTGGGCTSYSHHRPFEE